jgi:subtilisin family serine protease
MRGLAACLLSVSGLLAQVIPGRYLVELSTPSLGLLARDNHNVAATSARRSQIHAAQGQLRLWVEQHRGRLLDTLDNIMTAAAVELPEAELPGLRSQPGVAHIYPVYMLSVRLDRALPLHGVPDAWNAIGGPGRAGAGIKIGMLDTGITPEHPAFQDPALTVPDGYPLFSKPANRALTNNKIIVARSYEQFYTYRVGQTDDARDHFGHGTATATCAAGVASDAPLARISGVAPKAWIGVYKISALNTASASSDAILKAFDDALTDGMDVINLSFGSPFVPPADEDMLAVGIGRITQLGVLVVVSAGNDGPDLATVGNTGSVDMAITVGASDPDRVLAAAVTVQGAGPLQAVAAAGHSPDQPLSAPLADFRQLQPVGTLCDPLPPGRAAGFIVLAPASQCTFEMQLNNAQAAGAVAVIFSTASAQEAPFPIATGEAKLPAVSLGFADANTIRAAMSPDNSSIAMIRFGGVAFPADPRGLFGFSSRGPTYAYSLKPDLAATGYVYTATENVDDSGGLYDRSGYTPVSGTSFSAPIVAGATALLKSARPGLTAPQYRSLLINSATPMVMPNGAVERVQRTGTGVLNVAGALNATIAALPTSLSFSIGPGGLDDQRRLTLTNIGSKADTFTITTMRFDQAPALRFGDDPRGNGSAPMLTVQLAPGQSKVVYAFWRFDGMGPGEYEGLVEVRGTQNTRSMFIPYWYAVPADRPAVVTVVSGSPAQAAAGSSLRLFFRAIDNSGVAFVNPATLRFRGMSVSGGGSVGTLSPSPLYPNLVYADFTLGSAPGQNIFQVTFGDLPARTFAITATGQAQ